MLLTRVGAEPKINDASRGLMQVLLRTARGLGYTGNEAGLLDPSTNVYYGTRLLAENFDRARNWPDAISAYNGGFRPELGFGSVNTRPGLRCSGKTVPVGEYCNQSYVDRVNRYTVYFISGQMPPGGVVEAAAPLGLGLALMGGLLLIRQGR